MKVLLVRLSAIGDVLQGLPCLVALKESFPSWEISWLVEETSAPILENHPYLTKLFVLRRNWRKKKSPSTLDVVDRTSNLFKIWRKLRQERFDVAIDLQGLFKSGLWTRLSGAPRRMGHNKTREFAHLFLNEFVGDRPTFDPHFPLIDRYLEPARYLGADVSKGKYLLPPSSTEVIQQINTLLESVLDPSKTIALCPWSAWPSKNWPLARWCELAQQLSKDFRLIIIGNSTDQSAAEHLCSTIPHALNLVGKTSLKVLPEIFRRCCLVIGPDSGPLHLANATGVPRVLMLFGSTSWRRSGPLGSQHQILSTDLPCQPCFERICPLGHLHCQTLLKTEFVLETARSLAKNSRFLNDFTLEKNTK